MNRKKKKKKRPAPVIKFIFIFILVFLFGFFIFYIVDNPVFRENIKGIIFSEEKPDTIDKDDSDIIEHEDYDILELEITRNLEEDIHDVDEKEISFWQKIINFVENIKFEAKEEDTFPGRLTINIYFCSLGEESKLSSETRTILAGNPEIAVINAMEEILKGPKRSYHFPVIPAGTKLLDVEIYEQVAKINLSQNFLEESLDTRILDYYIIYSIVNTLTEIPEIEGVIFYIDGKRIRVYGNVDLTVPLIRNEEYLDTGNDIK